MRLDGLMAEGYSAFVNVVGWITVRRCSDDSSFGLVCCSALKGNIAMNLISKCPKRLGELLIGA